MGQCVVIDGAPLALDEGAYQQQQGALGLMEIGHHHAHYMECVARDDDNLGAAVEYIPSSAT